MKFFILLLFLSFSAFGNLQVKVSPLVEYKEITASFEEIEYSITNPLNEKLILSVKYTPLSFDDKYEKITLDKKYLTIVDGPKSVSLNPKETKKLKIKVLNNGSIKGSVYYQVDLNITNLKTLKMMGAIIVNSPGLLVHLGKREYKPEITSKVLIKKKLVKVESELRNKGNFWLKRAKGELVIMNSDKQVIKKVEMKNMSQYQKIFKDQKNDYLATFRASFGKGKYYYFINYSNKKEKFAQASKIGEFEIK